MSADDGELPDWFSAAVQRQQAERRAKAGATWDQVANAPTWKAIVHARSKSASRPSTAGPAAAVHGGEPSTQPPRPQLRAQSTRDLPRSNANRMQLTKDPKHHNAAMPPSQRLTMPSAPATGRAQLAVDVASAYHMRLVLPPPGVPETATTAAMASPHPSPRKPADLIASVDEQIAAHAERLGRAKDDSTYWRQIVDRHPRKQVDSRTWQEQHDGWRLSIGLKPFRSPRIFGSAGTSQRGGVGGAQYNEGRGGAAARPLLLGSDERSDAAGAGSQGGGHRSSPPSPNPPPPPMSSALFTLLFPPLGIAALASAAHAPREVVPHAAGATCALLLLCTCVLVWCDVREAREDEHALAKGRGASSSVRRRKRNQNTLGEHCLNDCCCELLLDALRWAAKGALEPAVSLLGHHFAVARRKFNAEATLQEQLATPPSHEVDVAAAFQAVEEAEAAHASPDLILRGRRHAIAVDEAHVAAAARREDSARRLAALIRTDVMRVNLATFEATVCEASGCGVEYSLFRIASRQLTHAAAVQREASLAAQREEHAHEDNEDEDNFRLSSRVRRMRAIRRRQVACRERMEAATAASGDAFARLLNTSERSSLTLESAFAELSDAVADSQQLGVLDGSSAELIAKLSMVVRRRTDALEALEAAMAEVEAMLLPERARVTGEQAWKAGEKALLTAVDAAAHALVEPSAVAYGRKLHRQLQSAGMRRRSAGDTLTALLIRLDRVHRDADDGGNAGGNTGGKAGGKAAGSSYEQHQLDGDFGVPMATYPNGLAARLSRAIDAAHECGVESTHVEGGRARLHILLCRPTLTHATAEVAHAMRDLQRTREPRLLLAALPRLAQCIDEAKARVDRSALPRGEHAWPTMAAASAQLDQAQQAIARRDAAIKVLDAAASGAKAASGVAGGRGAAAVGGRYNVQASLVHLQTLLPRAVEALQAAVDEAELACVKREPISEARRLLASVHGAGPRQHLQMLEA